MAAPGGSPDGLAIASPLVAAVSSLCWFFLQFLLSLVFSLFVCLFPFPAAGVPRRLWDLVERKSSFVPLSRRRCSPQVLGLGGTEESGPRSGPPLVQQSATHCDQCLVCLRGRVAPSLRLETGARAGRAPVDCSQHCLTFFTTLCFFVSVSFLFLFLRI